MYCKVRLYVQSSLVDDNVVHVDIVPTKLTELLYPLQGGDTPLYLAAREHHTTCVEHLLSTPGTDVDAAFHAIFRGQ